MSVCLFVCLSVSQSVCLSVSRSVSLSISLSVCSLSVCLSVSLSVSQYVSLFVCQSVCHISTRQFYHISSGAPMANYVLNKRVAVRTWTAAWQLSNPDVNSSTWSHNYNFTRSACTKFYKRSNSYYTDLPNSYYTDLPNKKQQ